MLFSKRPGELTCEDIQDVISGTPESSEVEFKGALPAKKGTTDPWLNGQREISDRARNELLEEVIAFANAYGGWMLVGIEETEDHPKRAKAVAPIRECRELADRLRKICRDCIDPQIPISRGGAHRR